MQITKQDVEEIADAICGRFDRDIVRRVTMGLSVDEDFGDCIRIVVYLDKDTTREDLKGRTGGVTAQVMGLLRDELKDLWPFVGFKMYSKDSDADPLPDQEPEFDRTAPAPISDGVPEALNPHGAGSALHERPPSITRQDVTEVADSIRGWCDCGIVRRVTMEPSADEEFGDCVRIVAFLNSGNAKEDSAGGADSASAEVMDILRAELRDLRPRVQFDEGRGRAAAMPDAGADPADRVWGLCSLEAKTERLGGLMEINRADVDGTAGGVASCRERRPALGAMPVIGSPRELAIHLSGPGIYEGPLPSGPTTAYHIAGERAFYGT